jgi:transposase-like protein
MDDPIRRLRAEARQLTHGKVPTAIRYPAAFRAAAVALAGPRLGQGASIARVARDLGLPMQSLGRWLRARPTRPVLRPVAVAPGPAVAAVPAPLRAGLVLVTAQGVRVEGLDRDALVAVLRALA